MDPLTCLALTIFFEAGNQDLRGKLAVGQVVMNRVESPQYPDTVCEVVQQGSPRGDALPDRRDCQFSWRCDGKTDRPHDATVFAVSKVVAVLALVGFRNPELDGVLHYHAEYARPQWATSMRVACQIGNHIFYRQT